MWIFKLSFYPLHYKLQVTRNSHVIIFNFVDNTSIDLANLTIFMKDRPVYTIQATLMFNSMHSTVIRKIIKQHTFTDSTFLRTTAILSSVALKCVCVGGAYGPGVQLRPIGQHGLQASLGCRHEALCVHLLFVSCLCAHTPCVQLGTQVLCEDMGFSNFSHVITYKSEVLLARTCKCPHRGKNDLTGLVCLYSSVLIKAGLHVHTHTHTHVCKRVSLGTARLTGDSA